MLSCTPGVRRADPQPGADRASSLIESGQRRDGLPVGCQQQTFRPDVRGFTGEAPDWVLKIVYVLTCRVLGLVVLAFRGGLAKDAELLVLRQSISCTWTP
jgi:hypothetical protein